MTTQEIATLFRRMADALEAGTMTAGDEWGSPFINVSANYVSIDGEFPIHAGGHPNEQQNTDLLPPHKGNCFCQLCSPTLPITRIHVEGIKK